jgi:hypothetical protein
MVTQTITKPLFGASGHPTKHNLPYFTSIVLDFGSTSHTNADVFEAITVPANTMVIAAGVDLLTADAAGNSGTLALGDGSVVYVAAATVATTGQMTHSDAVAEMFVSYDTINTLDLTVATGVLDGVVRIWALMVDYTDPIIAQRVTFA